MTPYLLALVLARTLDATTTIVALQSPYLAEGVPFMPSNPVAVVGVQGGLALGQIYVLRHIAKTRPKTAKVLAAIQVGTSGFAVTMNLKALHKVRNW